MKRAFIVVGLFGFVAGCTPPLEELDGGTIIDSGISLDAGAQDAGFVDGGIADAGIPDAGSDDAGVIDAGVVDAGVSDAGIVDAGVVDAGVIDAGVPDAGAALDGGRFFFPAELINGGLLDGGGIRHVMTADLDDDGHLDLVIAGTQRAVLFGDGDGGFPTEVVLPSPGVAAMSVVVDFDGDGQLDIVTSNSNLSNRPFTVSNNLGARQFQTAGAASGQGPTTVIAALGARGEGIEFALQSHSSDSVSHRTVLPDAGAINHGSINPTTVIGSAPNLVATDFNGDGQRDLVLVRPANPNTQVVYLAKEDGGFVERSNFSVPVRTGQWEYQLNALERSGAVLSAGWVQTAVNEPQIFRVQEDGGFSTVFSYPYNLRDPRALALADLDGDGVDELLVARGNSTSPSLGGDLLVLGVSGDVYVEIDRVSSLPLNANSIAVGDYDEDGRLDVVIGFYQERKLMLLRGR